MIGRIRCLGILAITSGCAVGTVFAAAPVPAPTLEVGDSWTIRETSEGTVAPLLTEAVRSVQGSVVEIVVSRGRGRTLWTYDNPTQRFLVLYGLSGGGVRQARLLDETGNDPLIRFPFVVGDSWPVSRKLGPAGDVTTQRMTGHVLGEERVTTPAGTFDTYKVELSGFWSADAQATAGVRGRETETIWYAPVVKHFVRREIVTNGWANAKTTSVAIFSRVDELVGYRLTTGASSATQGAATAEPLAAPNAAAVEFVAGTTRFAGSFSRDPGGRTYSGSGRIAWANGDVYEGKLVNGSREGQGTFTWADGQTYAGSWRSDAPSGQAVMRSANGDEYEGALAAGRPQGLGLMKYASGDAYAGGFHDGLPDGVGTFVWKNGDRYEGAWKAGQRHGRGAMVWSNGNRWEGEFVADQRKLD